MLVKPDYDTVLKSLRWSCSQNQVTEVRCLTVYRGQATVGYFNDPILAANAIVNGDNDGIAGTYVTLNPVTPEALARCTNHMVSARGNSGMFTQDKEIVERKELYLDFDPKRIAGISSTDAEHEAALTFMVQVTEALTWLYGWPVPCLIDSGNGGHARYMLETLPNDQASTDLVRAVLKTVAAKFNTDQVSIDTSVFTASRIIRVPGTPARKGEDTPDRPHRVSRILREYDPLDLLRTSCLKRLVDVHGVPLPTALEHAKRRRYEYPPDEQNYRKLNNTAKDRYHDWVPHLLGDLVRPSGSGYRIDSDKLGRDLEEAILIDHMGIKDFGVADMGDATEGRRTPISLLVELGIYPDKRQAAAQLAITLNTAMNDMGELALTPKPETAGTEPAVMPDALMGQLAYGMPQNGCTDADPFGEQPTKWMIQDLVVEQMFNLLSGPMRIGKSTLTRQVVAACLAGGRVLGAEAPQCEVMYVDYENMKNDILPDIRHQLTLVLADQGVPYQEIAIKVSECMKGFHYFCKEFNEEGDPMHRIPAGRAGIDHIARIVRENYPRVKLICIDPLRFMKDETVRSRDIVTQQWHEGVDFVGLCIRARAAIWAIHHDNKSSGTKAAVGNDPLLAAGGTAGLMASAQNSMSIQGDRIPQGVDAALGLYISPRIGQTMNRRIKFHNGRFEYTDEDAEIYYHRNDIKGNGREQAQQIDLKIISYLEKKPADISANIGEMLNVPKVTIDRRLDSLKLRGVVDFTLDKDRLYSKVTGPPPKVWFLVGHATLPN
jgi:hypothetical protein